MKKYHDLIGKLVAIIILGMGVLYPFADLIGIKIPKVIIIASGILIIIFLIVIFSAGFAVDLNISLPKGMMAFIYYIFGFLGGSIWIGEHFGFRALVFFVIFNGIIFYIICTRNE